MLNIKDVWENFMPSLGDREEELQEFYFSSTVTTQLAVSIFTIIISSFMIYMDLMFAHGDQRLFTYSLTVRVLFFLFTAGAIFYVLRNRSFKKVERAAIIWLFVTSLYFLFYSYTRPENYLTTSVDVLFILGAYVFFGYRLKYLLPVILFFSIASIWIAFSQKTGTLFETRLASAGVHILVQMIGLLAALQIRSFRRKAFLAYAGEREASQLATQLLQTDALTGCFSRRYFLARAEQEFLRARRYEHQLCVVMMDLNQFKSINDQYGHMAGDAVLMAFSNMVMEQKRHSDSLGRLGGEEFALLLPETSLENANFVARRIQETWANVVTDFSGHSIRSSVSVGVAELGQHSQNFEEMLHLADMFMYQKKYEHHGNSR